MAEPDDAATLRITGERYHPDLGGAIALEHLHRYALALELARNADVLDIASGEGYGADILSRRARSVVGVDLDAGAVRHAALAYRNPRLEFKVGICTAIPLESASVDLVVSFETLEHHDRHEEALAEIRRVLRPTGVLLLSTPDAVAAREEEPNPFHVRELSRREFADLLRRHFPHVELVRQTLVYGSLIVPDRPGGSFAQYRGRAPRLRRSSRLHRAAYNLALASGEPVRSLPVTLFDGREVLEEERRIQSAVVKYYERKLETGTPARTGTPACK